MKKKNIKKRIAKRGLSLRKNKKFFGTFVGIFAFIIIINATLAWSSYSEWVKNHMQSNPEEVAVRVTETFKQDSVMVYETPLEKLVRVKNISKRQAIVRVKFSESFLPFVLDMTDGQGNGDLKTIKRNTEELLNIENVSSWKSGSLLDSDLKDGGDVLYYQAGDAIVKNSPYEGEGARSSGPDQLKFFTWTFDPALHDTPQIAEGTPYWVFDGEYFYYSQVLDGGETTKIDLLKSVGLSDINIPNKYKSALYDIEIVAEGVTPTQVSLATWTTNPSYLAMYKEDARFK